MTAVAVFLCRLFTPFLFAAASPLPPQAAPARTITRGRSFTAAAPRYSSRRPPWSDGGEAFFLGRWEYRAYVRVAGRESGHEKRGGTVTELSSVTLTSCA